MAESRAVSLPEEDVALTPKRVPLVRTAIAGALMGMANLVPGISGGTMIVVMGLYDWFVDSVADATRLRFSRQSVLFLGVLVAVAVVTIAMLSGAVVKLVSLHQSAMYSLFIGLTIGGAPMLAKMLGKIRGPAVGGIVAGLAIMILIAAFAQEPPDKEAIKEAIARGEFVVEANYGRDVAAGVLGMAAMVLPGISGAYMLLVLGRYETILAAVSMTKTYVTSFGAEGDAALIASVMVPTAIGAILSLVAFSNLLKWLLHRHRQPAVGCLLGILLGSVVGIWPFDAASTAGDVGVGVLLAVVGFVITWVLSKVGA